MKLWAIKNEVLMEGDTMYEYYYYVNTFKNHEPVQLEGWVEASSEEEAIQKLIKDGTVDSHGYEFLELKKSPKAMNCSITYDKANDILRIREVGMGNFDYYVKSQDNEYIHEFRDFKTDELKGFEIWNFMYHLDNG